LPWFALLRRAFSLRFFVFLLITGSFEDRGRLAVVPWDVVDVR
jgi:hypothetical protein